MMAKRSGFLTGQGRFTDDLVPGDAARMFVLRSPVAHGRIAALNCDDARAMPGVLDAFGAEVLDAHGVGPLRTIARLPDMKDPYRPVLAQGKAVYLGQPVAVVIASSQAAAEDAAEAIELDIDELDPVLDPTTARQAPAIWDDVPGNLSFIADKGDEAATDAAFGTADHRVSVTLRHPRVSIAPIETRTCIARYDAGQYHLLAPSQGVVSLRREIAECMNIDTAMLHVVTEDVGGSFAVKIWPYPEQILALLAARRTGQPVHWVSGRGESLSSDAAGRGRIDHGELAFDADGSLRGFRVRATADMGAFLNSAAPGIVSAGAVRPFSQCYDIPNLHYRVEAVLTNAAPTDAYRGAGKPETTATLERLLDLAADKLGADRFTFRQANLIRPAQLPYDTQMGETYDSGDYPALATRLQTLADFRWI